MLAKFVGSHIHKDQLKVVISVYPSETDRCYPLHYVSKPIIPETGLPEGLGDEELQTWLISLPTRMELNPTFTHLICIDPSLTKVQLETQIQQIFTPDLLTSADAFLSTNDRRDFSCFRKMMAAQERLGFGLVLPKGYDAEKIFTQVNKRFGGLVGELDSGGKIIPIEPDTIDIGAAATDRGDVGSQTRTYVGKENPANASGTITAAWIWLNANTSSLDVELATFYVVSGDNLSTRDSELWDNPAAGSQQTVSGLSIDVQTGDYFGAYFQSGVVIERDASGDGLWWSTEDYVPCTNAAFTAAADRTISLYGEGAETAVGVPLLTLLGVGV